MNPLDVRTVMLNHLLTDAICSAVLIYLWLRNRSRFPGTFYWALDLTFQMFAVILIFLRGRIPGWMTFELSNFLVIAGAWMGLMGLEHFFGKKSGQTHNVVLLATFAAGFEYFLHAAPNLEARNLLISIGLFALCFQCVWLTFRRITKAEQRMAQMVGAVFIGFCLFSLARISVILAFPYSTNDFFQSGLYETLILLAYQILLILLTFGLVLMVNQRLHNEVQQEEEKFSRAFRSSPYAITLTRATDGQILEVNDGFSAITGFRPDEVIGKTTQELHLWVNADDRAVVTSELKKGNSVRAREFLFRKKNDQIVTGLFSADIIMIKDQPWILSSIADISDRKKAEQAIKDYSGHLEEMVAARTSELKAAQEKLVKHERLVVLGQLSGSVGHELRAPLGVMANAIYFLKMAQPEADPKIREYHDIIQSEIHNADKIISDLLDYSRVRSADCTAFSIGEACQNVLERYPVPKGIKLNLEISEPLPKAFADQKQIAQVLGNLALNAYQAMPEGGELAIRARAEGRTIAVSVEDTGVGISAKNKEQLFDPLFTTKPRGIGLGLTVSKMLMEANGGRIEVSSEEGKGSVFTIFVPIQEEKQ